MQGVDITIKEFDKFKMFYKAADEPLYCSIRASSSNAQINVCQPCHEEVSTAY